MDVSPGLAMKLSPARSIRGVLPLLKEKPLSTLSALAAVLIMLYSTVTILQGTLYIGVLNDIDATTLIMAGFLWLRAFFALRDRRDLETFSLALIVVLSFIFAYEAIYKASFYTLPNTSPVASGMFDLRSGSTVPHRFDEALFGIPPAELREGILQIAIALTILAGFAYGVLSFSRNTKLCLMAFVVSWAFWQMVGFPQIYDLRPYHTPLINLQLSWWQVYLLNRETKLLLFLAYFFLFKKKN